MFRSLSLFLALVPPAVAAFTPARAASDYPKQPIKSSFRSLPAATPICWAASWRSGCKPRSRRPSRSSIVQAPAPTSVRPPPPAAVRRVHHLHRSAGIVRDQQVLSPSLPYDPDTAFSPFSLVARFPTVPPVVHPSVGVTSIQELIDKAKANPGKVEYAHAGTGTTSHLAGALFGAMAKIDILNVPYKGTSQSLQDLVAGRVAFTIDNLGPILPFIVSGHLVALGVSTKEPASLLAGVPPINTVLDGYELSSWNVMAVPAGTPKDIVEKLSAECRRIVQVPDVIEKMRSFGSEPVGGTPEQVAVFLKEEKGALGSSPSRPPTQARIIRPNLPYEARDAFAPATAAVRLTGSAA